MYKDKKGIWRESVMINGKRKVFSSKSKQDLAMKLISYKINAPCSMKFKEVADSWEEENWERLRFGSYRTYAPCLKRCVEQFGDKDVDKIKPAEVQAWIRELGKDMAFKTVYNHKCIMSQIFDHAIVNLNLEVWNPCDKVKMPQGLKRGSRTALSDAERTAIRSTTKDEFQLAYLILFTGCRCGEALALQMSDVDMKRNLIHITKSISHHGNQPEISTTKTEKGVRTVPLSPQLKERLQELDLPKDAYIVSGEKPLTKSALDKRWKKWCKQKGISIDRHSIRHQYATSLYEAGVDVKTAQDLLGHAQFSTTMDIYTHLSENMKKSEYTKLMNYFSEQK